MREPPALPSPIHSCLPSYDGPGRGLFVAMILTCPSCGTQYVVKDGAIPPEGRQVRCAACKHSWHQNPDAEASDTAADEAPEISETVPADHSAPVAEAQTAADQEDESLAEAALIDPRSGPEAEERAYEEAGIEGQADAEPADPVEQAAQRPAEWEGPPEEETAA